MGHEVPAGSREVTVEFNLTSETTCIFRVFENRTLSIIFGCKREKVTEIGENCPVRRYIIFILRQILIK
jgi:hypothetical protein